MPVGPPLFPDPADAAAFEASLRRSILNPLKRQINQRVADAGASYVAIRRAIAGERSDPALQAMAQADARRHLRRQLNKHKARFRSEMRRYFGVRVDFMSDAATGPILERGIADSVSLIKTIPTRLHAGLTKDFTRLADTAPFDLRAVADVLRRQYGSSGYNLRRIARDQSNKLNGRLTEVRQTQLGVDQYVWSTSDDERVRPSHRRNDGKTFAWATPPPDTGHPGHDIQCRCVARPVIP